jgi:exodeoxyribonuclease VII large subunit
MSEKTDDKIIFSLLEVARSIQKTLHDRYKSSFWVKAEMNKLNYYKHSGHCYPDLVEKADGKVIAQMRAILWRDDYNRINGNFQRTLKEPLKDGIKILFQAKISFDPAHGLTLCILDIDPGFTLGDLEREKLETINRLTDEGIFTNNKHITLPRLPQRLAIISVETSKGYADFLKVIETNSWNYNFFHMLFPALLQGDKAVSSIIQQLERIKKVIHHFDVVAIIRGGGGDVGLSCYNNYSLAKKIAMFPIPVITGIGHATNETVVEMISHANAITPTKLAEFLLQKFHNFSVPVQEAQKKIIDKCNRLLREQSQHFHSEVKLFRSVTENMLQYHQHELHHCSSSIVRSGRYQYNDEKDNLKTLRLELKKSAALFIDNQRSRLTNSGMSIRKDANTEIGHGLLILHQASEKLISRCLLHMRTCNLEIMHLEKSLNNMSPTNVLRRGYSITYLNGKVVKSIAQVSEGDNIKTTIFDGEITSTAKSIEESENE